MSTIENSMDIENVKEIMGAMNYLITQIEYCEKKIKQSQFENQLKGETLNDWIRQRNLFAENLKKCISKLWAD